MDINLTDGNDSYTQDFAAKDDWNNYFGKRGDDIFKLYQGTVIGGPGADTIERLNIPGEFWRSVQAAYWDSPGGITVDLQAGWADDGWGSRDTLIGIRDVAGSWGGSNTLYGSTEDNTFFLSGTKSVVDGRFGSDTVYLPWFDGVQPTLSQFQIKVSIDGLNASITFPGHPEFQANLTSVETLIIGGDTEERALLSTLIKPEDVAIDGLVAGLSNRWNTNSAVGTPTEISFSFETSAPSSGVGANGFRAFSTSEQATVRSILATLTQSTGLTFKEVSETTTQHGDIRFGASQQLDTKGQTFLPGQNGDAAGDVWMDVDSLVKLTPGSEGYAALLHEIGHALGLRHTRNVDPGDHYALQVTSKYDLTSLSVMSQSASPDGLFPANWGALDIAALRYLYGSKSVNLGDTIYKISDVQFTMQSSIIDDGGTDTIDASLAQTGATINLNPGALSSIGVTNNGASAISNLSLGVNTQIENAIGSRFDDVILGNDAVNTLTGGDGNDWLDGGKGLDTAVFAGDRSDFFISTGFGKTFIAARDGVSGFDTLLNVEVLQFDDQRIVLGSAALAADIAIDVDENSQVSGNLPDPTDLTRVQVNFAIKSMPANGVLTLSNAGVYSYKPNNGFGADDSFTYTVSDGKGSSNIYTAYIQVHGTPNSITGSASNDMLIGTVRNDQISANNGDDTITGGIGNDTIDGGKGYDTAVFSGDLKSYSISHIGNSYTVRAKTGTDGTDTVSNVETLKFSDMTVNLTVQDIAASAPQADVQRVMELYVAFFNRVPDADGLAYWIGQMKAGQTINQIADSFYSAGVQYSDLTGFSDKMSNADFVNVIYRNVLGRVDGADSEGLAYWTGKLADGSASKGSLVSDILGSAHSFKGDLDYGWVADLLDNKITVAKTFAIDWGLGYVSDNDAIQHGMAIAAAVTASSTENAIALIGIPPANLHL